MPVVAEQVDVSLALDESVQLDDTLVGGPGEEEIDSQVSLSTDKGVFAEVLTRAKEKEDIMKLFDKITDSR